MWVLCQRRPNEASEFAGDGHNGYLRAFAPCQLKPHEAAMETLLSAVCDRHDGCGLPLAALAQACADAWPVPIVPGGIDSARRTCRLPDLVIPPCQREPPLECSLGTRPR